MKDIETIDYARKNFAHNRQIAERNLAGIRADVRVLLDFKHYRTRYSPLRHFLLKFLYQFQKRKIVALFWKTHQSLMFYRKVERDLEQGDLSSAIEALSVWAPRKETTKETVRRITTTVPSIGNISRSPNIIRTNMLRLRDDLMKIQQKKAC